MNRWVHTIMNFGCIYFCGIIPTENCKTKIWWVSPQVHAGKARELLTPDFDACWGGVLQRRKGSVWYDRWTWRGDRASPLKILLTEEGEIDQIFWLWFGKSYLVLELVLFYRIDLWFAVIGWDCVSVGYKYEPPGYCKDWYTSNKYKFTLLALYFLVGDFAIFFFFSWVLSSWSRTPHIRAIWFAGKSSFTE